VKKKNVDLFLHGLEQYGKYIGSVSF